VLGLASLEDGATAEGPVRQCLPQFAHAFNAPVRLAPAGRLR